MPSSPRRDLERSASVGWVAFSDDARRVADAVSDADCPELDAGARRDRAARLAGRRSTPRRAAQLRRPRASRPTALDLLAEAAWWLGRLDDCIDGREDGLPRLRRARRPPPGRAVRGVAVGAPRHPRPAGHRGRLAAAGAAGPRRRHRVRRARQPAPPRGGDRPRRRRARRRPLALATRGARARAAAAVGRPRGRGAADAGPGAHRPGRARRRHGPPRRGDALRRRGPAPAVLDRQGVLQPDRRLRGGRRLRPRRRVDRGDDAVGGATTRSPSSRASAGCTGPSCSSGAARWPRPRGRRRGRARSSRQSHVANSAAAYAEVGDIRRRLGDLDEAEEAFARSQEIRGGPCGGLALLRLAQGRVDAAMAIITGCVERRVEPAGPGRSAADARARRRRRRPARRGRATPSPSSRRSSTTFDTPTLRATALSTPRPAAARPPRAGGASRRCSSAVGALAGARRALRGGHRAHAARPGAPRRRRRRPAPRSRSRPPPPCSTRSARGSTPGSCTATPSRRSRPGSPSARSRCSG